MSWGFRMSKVKREIEETEDRESFMYFFSVLIIFIFLLGGWFLIAGLADISNLDTNFWGIYVIATGFGVIGLSSFPTFYKDRYGFTAMGLLLSIFGYFFAVFRAPLPIPNTGKGLLIMLVGLIAGGYVYYLNESGWELVRGNKIRYVGLILILVVFLLIWGLLGDAYL